MKTLINVFSSNSGLLARWATGLVMALVTASFAHLGFNLDEKTTLEVSGLVAMLVAGIIGELVTKAQAKNITAIQEAVSVIAPEVATDGHAGPVTVAAIERAATAIQEIKVAGSLGGVVEKAAAKSVKEAMRP